MKKRLNNKGFSLVELIIVIAIMAVLVAVLAPQYIKYVEESRVTTDENTVAEVIRATQTAIADSTIFKALPASNFTITVKQSTTGTSPTSGIACSTTGTSSLVSELESICGKIDLKSKTYGTKTYSIVVTYDSGNYTVPAYDSSNWG